MKTAFIIMNFIMNCGGMEIICLNKGGNIYSLTSLCHFIISKIVWTEKSRGNIWSTTVINTPSVIRLPQGTKETTDIARYTPIKQYKRKQMWKKQDLVKYWTLNKNSRNFKKCWEIKESIHGISRMKKYSFFQIPYQKFSC